jgi:hypothetical protein
MKRLLESDDDQRVHEWSQYFENLVEGLKDHVNKSFMDDKGFKQTHNYVKKTYKLTKSYKILFISDWAAPRNAIPFIQNKHVVKLGCETFSTFNKFATSFLRDLGDKLISGIDRNDFEFTTRIETLHVTSSSVSIIIEAESIKEFEKNVVEPRREPRIEDLGEWELQ